MALYRTMDRVLPHRAAIEGALAAREAELFNLDQTVLFYDVTSTYFEGLAQANPKARRGYSRDKRPDCKQVIVGLVVNRDGFPKAHEVFDGNRQDRTTLDEMLGQLDRRVGLRAGQMVVVDRGMAYAENLAQIKRRGLHYLVATRQRERDEWLDEFEDLDGFEELIRAPSPTNPGQHKTRVWVKGRNVAGVCYALCKSEGREQKDRAIRQKQEARLRADLAALAQRVAQGHLVKPELIHQAIGRLKERYGRVARYYQIEYDGAWSAVQWALDRAKLQMAERLDGGYLLKTDRADLSAEEIWRIYVLLTRAEKAFRNMKSPLAERPIFHQIARRVDAHILFCVLAYHLLVAIEKTLLDQGTHTSWWNLRQILAKHATCTVALPTDTHEVLRIRRSSIPDPDVAELYRQLNVPTEVMQPLRTWTGQGAT
jgi:transposase